MGFAGEALIPKYASSIPLVHGVALTRVAVPGVLPVTRTKDRTLRCPESASSSSKSPEAAPGETVKPKLLGGWRLWGY